MAVKNVRITAVENGYIVSNQELEATERGFMPEEKHYIFSSFDEILEFLSDKNGAKVKLQTV